MAATSGTPLDSKPHRISSSDWCEWGSAAASDALRGLGKPFQALEGNFRALAPDMRVSGPAFTVRCYPGATWALEQSLEIARPGDVLVVDAGGRADVIIMGALMSQRAKSRGIAGVIVDGAVRDVDEIVKLQLPVFSRFVCPRAGIHAPVGEWQTTICCGRVPVNPGDWIIADSSGITVAPIDLYEQVAAETAAIIEQEWRISELLRTGETLSNAVALARQEVGR